MKKTILLPIIAVLCITVIELYALSQSMDGLLLSGAIGIIAVIATGGTIKLRDVIKKNGNRTTDHS